MKQILKIRTILLLILLYLAVAGMYSQPDSFPDCKQTRHSTNIPSGEKSFFSTSPSFFAISENQVNGSNQIPAPSLKNHINDYTAHRRIASSFFYQIVIRYIHFSVQIDPGLPKTNIAFPFSYFW